MKIDLAPDDRFARFGLIEWWRQDVVAAARIVVVGAGAIGNEVLKNLALLGARRVVVVDMDHVEASNLSRSVLFRARDEGAPKATVAAGAARDLYPDLAIEPIVADVVHDVGAGLFRWADVVIGALDNREARLHVNRMCFAAGTPWIDGAIEALSGVARLFEPPEGPCYECTMSEADWRLLEVRRSCSLLARTIVAEGRVPTTPTTASIVAGLQCQEAIKLLHGRATLAGAGVVFEGANHETYRVAYQRNPECGSHDPWPDVVDLPQGVAEITAGALLARSRGDVGPSARLTFVRELLRALECPSCGVSETLFRPLSAVTEQDGVCPLCGARRTALLFHTVDADSPLLDRSLAELGLPPWDVVVGHDARGGVAYALAGDRRAVLGEACDE